MNAVWLVIFWAMQVIANLFFKYGSSGEGRWATGFILGNVVGASSIYFMMRLYARMSPNLVVALASGGAFVAAQVVMALVFHTRPSLLQWGGYAAVVAGMTVASLAAPPTK